MKYLNQYYATVFRYLLLPAIPFYVDSKTGDFRVIKSYTTNFISYLFLEWAIWEQIHQSYWFYYAIKHGDQDGGQTCKCLSKVQ